MVAHEIAIFLVSAHFSFLEWEEEELGLGMRTRM